MQYAAHRRFVDPARGYPQLWRLILGILTIALCFLLATIAFMGVAVVISGGFETADSYLASVLAGNTPTGTMVLLATFIGLFLGPLLVARLLHRRRGVTLFGPLPRTLRHGLIAAAIAAPILALSGFLPPGIDIEPNLSVGLWFSFLPLALVLILVQTGAEELAFRGYLQQQLAARYDHVIVWMVLPTGLFAIGHYSPDVYGEMAWTVVAAVGLFAIFAADLTARTGSIGAAWGFHFANNVAAILFVSIEGPLSGAALFIVPDLDITPEVLQPALWRDMAVTTAIWLAIRLVLRPAPEPEATASPDQPPSPD